ncbi:FliI/YscN family ATPase [Variovorax saccharolyticus]|uniref:FliI/YscN family ATPase n=1 Tax=Variovorax saccharolyticus TaxID=3053516 RepID=UPI002576429B|nr:FliI/YscN family ATPase [Variovorax sp. J31P216]MDM0030171.1 FliI/YscN family ATPase [Variovorax sp. J31P216]
MVTTSPFLTERCASVLNRIEASVAHAQTFRAHGRIVSAVGQVLRVVMPTARLGELCHLHTHGVTASLEAEVIGFVGEEVLLSPLGEMTGVGTSTIVVPAGRGAEVPVGQGLLGRIVDGRGHPLDNLGPLDCVERVAIHREAPAPMTRAPVDAVLHTGVRAIDAVLTCGIGQRLGLFAAAGVGKSTLLGMLAKSVEADVVVIGLVGERGREVREFVDDALGPAGLRRSVVVCATSDRTAMERVRAAMVATAYAEYFRDQGKQVLLLIDSITRFARAMREIGLAAGEPPARRGYPPSVFAALPRLLERAGNSDRGSISAFYTVLVEGDDMNEPVADETRSILDGHIVLSRKLASAGHFPAIDVLQSVSRVMHRVVPKTHAGAAVRLRNVLAKVDELELVIKLGEYEAGHDTAADDALGRIDGVKSFLRQEPDESIALEATRDGMRELLS